MGRVILEVYLVLLSSRYINCNVAEDIVFPDTVQHCYDKGKQQPVNLTLVKEACWRVYLEDINTHPILSDEDKEFFKTEYEIPMYGYNEPPTGFRTRYDIRVLTNQQREDVFDAFKVLYQNGILHRFGLMHGVDTTRKHRGRAFLPWHRVFITAFEEQLRKVNPTVSLPYWDYTTDYYMASPYKSVIWTDCFVGNGFGNITSGPFAGWYGGNNVEIERSTSQGEQPCPPNLISKTDIDGMLRHFKFEDITTGTESPFSNKDNLEVHHDGVPDWVGGDMDTIRIAAFDPIFWMHHAFVDYIWEQFRERQGSSECGVDVEMDYPETNLSLFNNSLNAGTDPLQGFEYMQIKDGLWKNWTTKFFKYEPQPQCPDCGGSSFFKCDKDIDNKRFPNGVCVSKDWNACHSVHEVDKGSHHISASIDSEGFPGIGRTRMNSDEENLKLLKKEIAMGTKEEDDDGDDDFSIWKIAVIVLSSLLAMNIIGVVVYCCVNKRKHDAHDVAHELSSSQFPG